MLVATLPNVVYEKDLELAEKIISNLAVNSVRYNTGGDSPLSPLQILGRLNIAAKKYNKKLWIDLKGRQVRVLEWTPYESGSVKLNRKFKIKLPGKVFFRRTGWCEIVAADTLNQKIFFNPSSFGQNYFLGASQSVHIVAKEFEVAGYLCEGDEEYIKSAANLNLNNFMLSFVESQADINEFKNCYYKYVLDPYKKGLGKVILKIESQKGLDFIEKNYVGGFQLMAARDDLWLAFVNKREHFLEAVKRIVTIDPNALVASKMFSGLEFGSEATMGDLTDIALMKSFGYKNFMLSDELSKKFEEAVKLWSLV